MCPLLRLPTVSSLLSNGRACCITTRHGTGFSLLPGCYQSTICTSDSLSDFRSTRVYPIYSPACVTYHLSPLRGECTYDQLHCAQYLQLHQSPYLANKFSSGLVEWARCLRYSSQAPSRLCSRKRWLSGLHLSPTCNYPQH